MWNQGDVSLGLPIPMVMLISSRWPNWPSSTYCLSLAAAPTRCLVEESMNPFDIATEVAHNVQRVRGQCTDVEPGRCLIGVADPHGHVDQQQMAQLAFFDLLLVLGGGPDPVPC